MQPASVCEVAWSLGLASVVVINGRLERGREQRERWRRFVTALEREVESGGGGGGRGGRVMVVATSEYDAAYTHFLTGIRPLVARALPPAANVTFDPQGPVWVVHTDLVFGI
jgi:hypothetical protein